MLTLGVVPYLNALPLYRGLETGGVVQVVRDVPARLESYLESGQRDAALLPIVDFFRGVGDSIISDACIGSDGAVRSVLLFSRVPVREVQSVAIDTSSHTSVALLRVLLADGYGTQPPFIEYPPDLDAMLDAHDAALLIGDKALEAEDRVNRRAINVLDLGNAWLALTGLPFVFAAWVARRGLEMEVIAELSQLLNRSREAGVRNLPAILADNPVQTTLKPAQIEDYLRHAVTFTLTPQHRAGMTEFQRRCMEHGLL